MVEDDAVCYFRVAAVNDVGIGPYSRSVSYTQRRACEYTHTLCIYTCACSYMELQCCCSTVVASGNDEF